MLMLSYGCGLRSGEVVHLRRQDLQFQRGMILVHKGKGHKDRQVPMGKSLRKQLQKYLGEYRVGFWCFEGSREGMPYHASSLRMVFKRALAQAGLHASVRLHDLRHSFATHLMESGTDIKIIQALLGHESIVTTQIYTHVSSTSILDVVSPIEDLLDE
jgi:Site-specific recombinase XerD